MTLYCLEILVVFFFFFEGLNLNKNDLVEGCDIPKQYDSSVLHLRAWPMLACNAIRQYTQQITVFFIVIDIGSTPTVTHHLSDKFQRYCLLNTNSVSKSSLIYIYSRSTEKVLKMYRPQSVTRLHKCIVVSILIGFFLNLMYFIV